MKKIITGEWNGEAIWRQETAEDRLLKELWDVENQREQKKFEDLEDFSEAQ